MKFAEIAARTRERGVPVDVHQSGQYTGQYDPHGRRILIRPHLFSYHHGTAEEVSRHVLLHEIGHHLRFSNGYTMSDYARDREDEEVLVDSAAAMAAIQLSADAESTAIAAAQYINLFALDNGYGHMVCDLVPIMFESVDDRVEVLAGEIVEFVLGVA